MSVCLKCHSNLTDGSVRCDFCHTETPTEQAKWMRHEAVVFMHRSRMRERVYVGPRSQYVNVARSLCDMRVFRLAHYVRGSRISIYEWTPYGRALRDACGRPSRAA